MNPDAGTFDFVSPDGTVRVFRWKLRHIRELESALEQTGSKVRTADEHMRNMPAWSAAEWLMLMQVGFGEKDGAIFEDWPAKLFNEFKEQWAAFFMKTIPEASIKKNEEMVQRILRDLLPKKEEPEPVGQT